MPASAMVSGVTRRLREVELADAFMPSGYVGSELTERQPSVEPDRAAERRPTPCDYAGARFDPRERTA
ncbi:hypothetical protein CH278_23145 [Rhodococcus sp. 05-2254-5]|nr:hypothetical protein CH278_23145 [Rhodococcus sp. 05-2254-5]OZE53220.1 hypothetical protein CH269_18485 [Rhodococcus sp. 05-2254-1]